MVGSPIIMCPPVFKALLTVAYWLLVIYPMGKGALMLKGGTCCSAILVAAM